MKFREFEHIAQGHPLNGYAAQCQNSCFCYFTKNSECIKSYRLQAKWTDRDLKKLELMVMEKTTEAGKP